MKLRDLVVDDVSDKLSHTKVGALVGYAAMTAVFVRVGWNATPSESLTTLFFVYGGIVASSQVASKLIGHRYGGTNGQTPATTPAGG